MAYHTKHQKSQGFEIERLVPTRVPWYRKRIIREHMQRYRFVRSHVKQKIVADIACGSGFGSFEIAKHARRVIGIDNNAKAILYAKKHYAKANISYLLADATKTTLEKHSVDVVVSFETIEHLKNPQTFLKEIERVLSLNGAVILSTPNKEFSVGTNHFHHQEYTLSELQQLLSGFKKVQYFGQREVNTKMFALLKKLSTTLPVLSFLLPFRFWEQIRIEPITNKSKTNYVYFLAVCKK